MGTGRKRKNNDQVIIRRPKKILAALPAGGSPGHADVVADTCPPGFMVKLDSDIPLKENAVVRLSKKGQHYVVVLGTIELAVVNISQSQTIEACSSMGVRYVGRITFIKNRPYAEFTRKA